MSHHFSNSKETRRTSRPIETTKNKIAKKTSIASPTAKIRNSRIAAIGKELSGSRKKLAKYVDVICREVRGTRTLVRMSRAGYLSALARANAVIADMTHLPPAAQRRSIKLLAKKHTQIKLTGRGDSACAVTRVVLVLMLDHRQERGANSQALSRDCAVIAAARAADVKPGEFDDWVRKNGGLEACARGARTSQQASVSARPIADDHDQTPDEPTARISAAEKTGVKWVLNKKVKRTLAMPGYAVLLVKLDGSRDGKRRVVRADFVGAKRVDDTHWEDFVTGLAMGGGGGGDRRIGR
jgi:hypothetical protein